MTGNLVGRRRRCLRLLWQLRRRRPPKKAGATKSSGALGAEDHAGDVVGLAGRSNEGVDGGHQELQRLLGADFRKVANRGQPAAVAKFLAVFVEGFRSEEHTSEL